VFSGSHKSKEPGWGVSYVWQGKNLRERFLEVWQALDLAGDSLDVWQIQGLAIWWNRVEFNEEGMRRTVRRGRMEWGWSRDFTTHYMRIIDILSSPEMVLIF